MILFMASLSGIERLNVQHSKLFMVWQMNVSEIKESYSNYGNLN